MNRDDLTALAADITPNDALAGLVGNADYFVEEVWRRRPEVFRTDGRFRTLISEHEMWSDVECGLLIRPYFVSFNDGVRSALADITETRSIVGHDVPGYVNAEQVKREFGDGGTFKYNQPEHWKPAFKALVRSLQSVFRAEIETYVFLSPPDRTAIATHMDGSHVFVLQIAGEKEWTVGYLTPETLSGSDRYNGPSLGPDDALRTTLCPGDVLYMPHGAPHHATARNGNSIHVAITVEEPSPQTFSEVLLSRTFDTLAFRELERTYHQRSVGENVEALRAAVRESISQVNPDVAIKDAVTAIRTSLPQR